MANAALLLPSWSLPLILRDGVCVPLSECLRTAADPEAQVSQIQSQDVIGAMRVQWGPHPIPLFQLRKAAAVFGTP